jgi:hypothetical protein
MPAAAYLESLGLSSGGKVWGFESMPFVIGLDDGSTLTRSCIGSTEDGGLALSASLPVPVGSTLAITTLEADDVIASVRSALRETMEKSGGRSILIYSCVARNWALGTKVMAEHEEVTRDLGDAVPYHFVYSGGEIFPAFLKDGRISNHLQNNTIILCAL